MCIKEVSRVHFLFHVDTECCDLIQLIDEPLWTSLLGVICVSTMVFLKVPWSAMVLPSDITTVSWYHNDLAMNLVPQLNLPK